MSTVIYADSLLAVNFSMDFLSLFICAKLTKAPIKPIRLFAAAMLGAVCALFCVTASAYIELGIAELVITAVCAYIMSLCAFGGKAMGVLHRTVAYLAVNIGLGGLMTALFSITARTAQSLGIKASSDAKSTSPAAFIVTAIISGAVSLAYGKLRERTITRKRVTALVTSFGNEQTLSLLSDSGNLLVDPFTQKPVIIVSAKRAEMWLPKYVIEAACFHELSCVPLEAAGYRIRFIPTGSVTGSSLLTCFVPDKLVIDGNEREAIIAIDTISEDYDGCDGLIPQSLLII